MLSLLIENYNFQVLRPGKKKRGLSAKNLLMLNNKHAISDIKKGLLNFTGVQRRFNKIFTFNNVDFF